MRFLAVRLEHISGLDVQGMEPRDSHQKRAASSKQHTANTKTPTAKQPAALILWGSFLEEQKVGSVIGPAVGPEESQFDRTASNRKPARDHEIFADASTCSKKS